ncbi:hypothetical protein [Methylocystis echinoides]|uniref:hypothetical protein n=1 Tax=Methylocystis echinoides TaxID=29468 RepID=UPI00341AA51A
MANNLESQRRQYALVERARQLGCNAVQLIDADLGKSGGGTVCRLSSAVHRGYAREGALRRISRAPELPLRSLRELEP